jgi:hypothetical protein
LRFAGAGALDSVHGRLGQWVRWLGVAVFAGLGMTQAGIAAEVPAAALERRVGHAFSLATGEALYREIHQPRVRNGRLLGDRVRYVTPDGTTFARKEVDFTASRLAPAFRLIDQRTGYVEGLTHTGADRIRLVLREGPRASVQRGVLKVSADVVADAGFDLLIFKHFDALKAGETLRFPFAAPSQLDTVTFRLRRIERREVLGEPAVIIRMEPDYALFRWLADPIDVAYHAETAALLRYEGLSNIPKPNADDNYRVRIDFPPEGVQPQPPK